MDRENTLSLPDMPTSVSHCRSKREAALPAQKRGITVRTARSREDFRAAFTILQKRYEETGLARYGKASMRIMPYHLSAPTQVFIASKNDEVVGTVTLVRDSIEGLPIASNYPAAIADLRNQSRRIGEITSLAVDSSMESPGEIFSRLTRLLTFFARSQGIDHLAAVVHPRHARFYQGAMGFDVIGRKKRYAAVCGNPGIAVLGSVNDPSRFRSRWRDYYFDGDFPADELRPCRMSDRDCEYFYRSLSQQ